MNTTRERAVIFIDGNNFYHAMRRIGLTAGAEFDYEAFSRKLVTEEREWVETRYYIGRIRQEGDLTRYQNQRMFLSYLEQFPSVKIFLGRVESRPPGKNINKQLQMWLKSLPHRSDIDVPPQIVGELSRIANTASTPLWVEKAVDVMIATDIVSMAYEGLYDVAYLVSADGDFTPAVQKARECGRKVFAASPSQGHQLAQAVDTFIRTKRDFFHGCWR